jgi:hypothetical protein
MPFNRFEWLRRVKAVEREHTAVRYAADYLLDVLRLDPTVLDRVLRVRDVREAVEKLEGTYVVRLFAEFETCLRTYWLAARSTDPPSRTKDLLDGIGATRRIPHDDIQFAHAVRDFRNALVHERAEVVPTIEIARARGYLCRYLRHLPLDW